MIIDDNSPSPYATASPVAADPKANAIALRLGGTVCARFPGLHASPKVKKSDTVPPFIGERDRTYFVTCVSVDGQPVIVVRIQPWQIETESLASPPPVIDGGEK